MANKQLIIIAGYYNGAEGFQNVAAGRVGEYRIENEALFNYFFETL